MTKIGIATNYSNSLYNPLSKRSSKKWDEIYERTLAHIRAQCRTRLQAAPGKASSAISELVESVRSNLDSATVNDTRVLLAAARSVNPIDGFSAYH